MPTLFHLKSPVATAWSLFAATASGIALATSVTAQTNLSDPAGPLGAGQIGHLTTLTTETPVASTDSRLNLHAPAFREIADAFDQSVETVKACRASAGSQSDGRAREDVAFQCDLAFLSTNAELTGRMASEYRATAETVRDTREAFRIESEAGLQELDTLKQTVAAETDANTVTRRAILSQEPPAKGDLPGRMALMTKISNYLHAKRMTAAKMKDLAEKQAAADDLATTVANLDAYAAVYDYEAINASNNHEYLLFQMERAANVADKRGRHNRINGALSQMPTIATLSRSVEGVNAMIERAEESVQALSGNSQIVQGPDVAPAGDLEAMLKMLRDEESAAASSPAPSN